VWVILVLAFPIIGILAYLILRGDRMRAHQVQASADQEALFRQYAQRVGGPHRSKTDELARLVELRDHGNISSEEYEQLKAEVMNQDWTATGS
jgi:hypothetical protein